MAVTKGDSAYFTITITGDVPEDGTDILFTVKDRQTRRTLIKKHFSVYGGVVFVELLSQDTNKLEPGNYFWDIRVIFSDDEIVTPMTQSTFTVLEAVGDV